MLQLLALYLAVHLPFRIVFVGSHSYLTVNYSRAASKPQNRLPLALTDDNYDLFLYGMAALNYNILYLCHTQGIHATPARYCMPLANLQACARSPDLGRCVHCVAGCWFQCAAGSHLCGRYSTLSLLPVRSTPFAQTRAELRNDLAPFHCNVAHILRVLNERHKRATDDASEFGLIGLAGRRGSDSVSEPITSDGDQDDTVTGADFDRDTILATVGNRHAPRLRRRRRSLDAVFAIVYPYDLDTDDSDADVAPLTHPDDLATASVQSDSDSFENLHLLNDSSDNDDGDADHHADPSNMRHEWDVLAPSVAASVMLPPYAWRRPAQLMRSRSSFSVPTMSASALALRDLAARPAVRNVSSTVESMLSWSKGWFHATR